MTVNEAENVGGGDPKVEISEAAVQGAPESNGRAHAAAGRDPVSDVPRSSVLEVTVDHSIEKAMKILKRKLIKEGLFKELKMRRYFEKPSERRKRKQKESLKKARKEASRMKKNPFL